MLLAVLVLSLLSAPDALAQNTVVIARIAVKEAAHELGAYATFMPKPLAEHPGSGMHLHISLFQGERNALDERAPGIHVAPS